MRPRRMATTCGKVISSRPSSPARGAEAARLHAAERHARIGGRDDEVVDEDEAGLDACARARAPSRCRARRWTRRARSRRRSRRCSGGLVVDDALDRADAGTPAARQARATRSSATDCTTMRRRGAMQVSPSFSRVPKRSARTTRSRSASARTSTASSPESSITEGVLVSRERGENVAAVLRRAGEDRLCPRRRRWRRARLRRSRAGW